MSDIGILARTAYETGIDPITYAAEHVIQSHVEIFLAVRDVSAEIGCPLPHDAAALSRRILGDLLDAGVDTTGGGQVSTDTYRVLVTGSREWDDAQELRYALIHATALRLDSAVIVHGACPTGADAMAAEWARDYGVPAEPHAADWDQFGKAAGPRRNAEMVALGADLCLAFFKQGAGNKGTGDCASQALAAGIPVRRVTS